jgi:hypothetical protein
MVSAPPDLARRIGSPSMRDAFMLQSLLNQHRSFSPRTPRMSGPTSVRTPEQERTVTPISMSLVRVRLAFLPLVLAGCLGAQQTSPDNPTGAGGLVPTVEDKDAGLVAVAPGFNVKDYPIITVAPFPVTDPSVEDEGDRRFSAELTAFLRTELVRRLRESGLFQRVVDLNETDYKPDPADKALRLDGTIPRLGRGSQAARYFAGLYGAGRTRAQADMRFVEVSSGRVVMVTADRRVASLGLFGGSDRDHLRESFDDMARDLAKFLLRLSRGEAPKRQ